MRRVLAVATLVVAAFALWAWTVLSGIAGATRGAGRVEAVRLPEPLVAARAARREAAAQAIGAAEGKQILFGDLHAHTTFSSDAFLWSLPLLQGDGAHPPADACHFARFCSGLDFWSINDHAESLTPRRWKETVAAIRACNAAAGDPAEPDVVAFLGWEWTQVGATPDRHFGHKNVVLLSDDPAHVPARPIAAGGENLRAIRETRLGLLGLAMPLVDFANRQAYYDLARFQTETSGAPLCGPEPSLEEACVEVAETPAELFAGLDRWGGEALVIPHGTSWGATTPPGASWSAELRPGSPEPDRQALIEVYSGHGNSEEYRPWSPGSAESGCPPPRDDYLPICWQAGEIIRGRCLEGGADAQACDDRAAEARSLALAAGRNAVLTVPKPRAGEWRDAEQCRDCFLPAFAPRPGKSVQAALASRGAAGAAFRFGLIASSDNHSARPGSGYKEFGALGMTDARGLAPGPLRNLLAGGDEAPARSVAVGPEAPGVGIANSERQASFWMTGGLVAVHAEGRSRDAIWRALERREVYGTSGPRILLWFDVRDGPDGEVLPMGSAAALDATPQFRVRAVGSAEPQPGCPPESHAALGVAEVERLCLGECHHPGDRRRPITRIEVVRIRRQQSPAEPLAPLIEDPWRVLPCPEREAGCEVRFDDASFGAEPGEWTYYVRAIEAPSPAVGGAGIGCAVGESDCLGAVEERAWSSPLFLRSP